MGFDNEKARKRPEQAPETGPVEGGEGRKKRGRRRRRSTRPDSIGTIEKRKGESPLIPKVRELLEYSFRSSGKNAKVTCHSYAYELSKEKDKG